MKDENIATKFLLQTLPSPFLTTIYIVHEF